MSPREIEDSVVPFVQVDSRLARRSAGSGLGLPITKRLIEMHGGRLLLESAPRAFRGGNSRHTRNLRAMHDKPNDRQVQLMPPGRQDSSTATDST